MQLNACHVTALTWVQIGTQLVKLKLDLKFYCHQVQSSKTTATSYRVLAMTLFFLGCWLTGLPTVLLFFNEPFLASSLCFSERHTHTHTHTGTHTPG